jgi:hypothetical protein
MGGGADLYKGVDYNMMASCHFRFYLKSALVVCRNLLLIDSTVILS